MGQSLIDMMDLRYVLATRPGQIPSWITAGVEWLGT